MVRIVYYIRRSEKREGGAQLSTETQVYGIEVEKILRGESLSRMDI